MLVAGGGALIAVAARLARLPWILLFTQLWLLYQYTALYQGLEAAAALFMLALFFLAVMLYARDSQRWQWPLAAVAFSLPWVRLEYIAISLAVTAVLGLIEWSWERAGHRARKGRSVLAMNAVAPMVGAIAGILVYFAYNGIVFGGVTPVSGATKLMVSQRLWEQEGGYNFVQNFRDVLQIPVFDYELRVALEDLRLCRSGLVVRPPFQGPDRLAAVGLPRVCIRLGGRPSRQVRSDRSHCASFLGELSLVFRPGVSDDGADCSRTMLRRHSLRSPFIGPRSHRAAIFCAWALPLSARSSCLQRRISPLRSGWLTRRAGQPSANGRLLLTWVRRSWIACSPRTAWSGRGPPASSATSRAFRR